MSDTTPDTGDTTSATETEQTTEPNGDGQDMTVEQLLADREAELAKWKAQARKHEERAKANAAAAKQLEEVKRQGLSDAEKAIAEARDQAKAEAAREFGGKLAVEAIRGAARDRVADVDALIDGIDPTKFLGDDGEPDRDRIAEWVDKVAPKVEQEEKPFPDLAQGVRTNARSEHGLAGSQLERDLKQALGAR